MKTYIKMLIDRSGSMASVRSKTVNSINEYIQSLILQKIDARISINFFDTDLKYKLDLKSARLPVPIDQCKLLELHEYEPRGMTPLYDSIYYTISQIKSEKAEDETKVIFVIITDGEENASQEMTSVDAIRQIVENVQSENGWSVVYLGCDHNVLRTSEKIGIKKDSMMQYGKDRIHVALNQLATSTVNYARSSDISVKFSDEQKQSVV